MTRVARSKPAPKKRASKASGVLTVLELDRDELKHLRDLMSMILPIEEMQTISNALAAASEVGDQVDENLWRKVHAACVNANIDVDEDAPDYVIAPTANPTLGVFRVEVNKEEASEEQDG